MRQVYVIAGGGYTKVGVTVDVDQRLRALQIASPHRLRVVAVVPGGVSLERGLVYVMAQRYARAQGEWFEGELSEERAEEIDRKSVV